MSEVSSNHRFYCNPCRFYLVGASAQQLANCVNSHNAVRHPQDFSTWTDKDIIRSAFYSGPTTALAKTEYTVAHGTTSTWSESDNEAFHEYLKTEGLK
jgi:hypothetical protein